MFFLCVMLLAAWAGGAEIAPAAAGGPSTGGAKSGDYVWTPEVSVSGPVVLVVSIPEQTMFVYRNGVPVGHSAVHTGEKGHPTPTGVFTILQKHEDRAALNSKGSKASALHHVVWSGAAVQAEHLAGYPASRGLVQVPEGFAAQLDLVTSNSTTILVTDQMQGSGETATPGLLLGGKTGEGSSRPLPASGFDWHPQKSPTGPVAIIFSAPDSTAYVYRKGVLIGRSRFVLDQSEHIRGSHAYQALDGVDAEGRRNWLATTSLGGGAAPDVKALAEHTAIPAEFLEKVRAIIVPGTTLIISDLPVTRRTHSKPGFGILTADAAR